MDQPTASWTSSPEAQLLARQIRTTLAIDPDKTALTFDGAELPWAYLADTVADLTSLLSGYPLARRVGVVLRNRPGAVAAVVAALATGRHLIPLSPHLGDEGLAGDIRALAPDVVVAEPQDWERAALVAAVDGVGAVPLEAGKGGRLFARTPAVAPRPSLRDPGDVAVLMMTSGTTGHPKRIELSHAQLVASLRAAGIPLDAPEDRDLKSGTAILWASLAHISGLFFLVAHVVEGRGMALLEKFEVDRWVDLVRRHRPGFVRLAPAAMRMVLQAEVDPEVFRSVRAIGSGSAPLPPELAEAIEDRYGCPVLGTYGATEFAGAIAGWTFPAKKEWGHLKRGSVGRAFAGIELRIVDAESGAELPRGEVGLLEARGGQLPVSGERWLRTTDLALLDTDDFLYIRGRADDAINRGGFKIPPAVIEEALAEHPSVHEAAAVGVPDDRLGELPMVAVTLQGPATEEELLEHLRQRLTRYQQPARLRIVPDLPRTPSMKVSRPAVRDRYFPAESDARADA